MSYIDLATQLKLPQLNSYLDQVGQKLNSLLPIDNPEASRSMSRIINAKSKRLRSCLLLAVVTSNGSKIDDIIITACAAIELTHIATLVHDDIIDDADSRWDIATLNGQEGNSLALVMGDDLLASSFLTANRISQATGEKLALTIRKLCSGETFELQDQYNLNRSLESYLAAIKGKTSSLISAACEIGAMCAHMPADVIEAFASYGENFGMSFQIIDDLVDIISEPELLSKPTGNDIRQGIYTLPVILALNSDHKQALTRLIKHSNGLKTREISDLLINGHFIDDSISLVREYNQHAVEALKKCKDQNRLISLLDFPSTYLNWTLAKMIPQQLLS